MIRLLLLLLATGTMARAGETLSVYIPDFNRFYQGREVYERNCVLCHGSRGDGKGELSPGLTPRPRSFREGLFKFRSTPWGKLPADADLRRTITHGLSGTAMGMFATLQEEDVAAVIEYLKSFSRRWRKAENYAEPVRLEAAPNWLTGPVVPPARLAEGRMLFEAACATCHGAKADGKGPVAQGLRDAWGQLVAPSDLRQPHPRSGDRPEDLYRTLVTGLNGTPMISYEAALTPAQRWSVIAYILSLRIKGPPTL